MKYIYLMIFICFLFCCNSNDEKIQRESTVAKVVTDSIYTRMPGVLLKFGDYAVWQDPFGVEGFIHVIDMKIGKEIGVMGEIGQGPDEFNTPSLERGKDNSIMVFDLNIQKDAIFSIDSLRLNINYYIHLPKYDNRGVTRKILLNDNSILSLTPGNSYPFTIENKGVRFEFGAFPIKEKINNGYNIFQGNVCYNEDKELLVYSLMNFFSLNIYERHDKETFTLKKSVDSKINYRITDSELKLDENNEIGPAEMTLTKDYIVTIQHDYNLDKAQKSSIGMDFTKNPRTVFLYDYNGNLVKIIDVGIPLLRIAGEIHNNELYAIGIESEFVLVKFEV